MVKPVFGDVRTPRLWYGTAAAEMEVASFVRHRQEDEFRFKLMLHSLVDMFLLMVINLFLCVFISSYCLQA